MAENFENIDVDIKEIENFEKTEAYYDGAPLSAHFLNKPVIRLKKELNKIYYLLKYLLLKNNIPQVSTNKTYRKDAIVKNENKYYIAKHDNAKWEHSNSWEEIKILSPKTIEELYNPKHPENVSFETALLNVFETTALSYSSIIEYNAEILRMMGASGLYSTRQYTFSEPFNPKERVFGVTYNAMGQHNHPNYRGMPGTAELSAIINGYYIRTRHNDYRMFAPVKGGYLARKEILPPPVPASVLSLPIGTYNDTNPSASQYGYMKNIYNTSPEDCVFFLSYLEIWFEKNTSSTGDYTDSFRHSVDANSMREAIEKAIYLNSSGHKNRLENIPFSPIIVRRVNKYGEIEVCTLRYRINSFPVATLSTNNVTKTLYFSDGTPLTLTLKALPFNALKAAQGIIDNTNKFKVRKDLRQVLRDNKNFYDSSRTWENLVNTSARVTFDLEKGLLKDLCQMLPGLMGVGSYLEESYNQYGLNDTLTVYNNPNVKLNAAYYNHEYSFLQRDASNRSNAHRGFNDPNLFVAKTNNEEVMDGVSYMIPLELVLRTPRESWNPYNVPLKSHAEITANGRDGTTQSKALNGYHYDEYNFTLPNDLFSGQPDIGTDVADTISSAWVLDGNGISRLMRASGINIFDYHDGTQAHRKRFAVFPEFFDYSKSSSDLEIYKSSLKEVLKKVINGTATIADIEKLY